MFKNLLRSLTTIGLLLVLIVIGVIVLFQNNNIEHKLLKENTSLKTSLGKAELAAAGAGGSVVRDIEGPFAKYAMSFSLPGNLLTLDENDWLPKDAPKGGQLKSYLTSDPKGLNFLTQNGSDVSALQGYIGIGLVARHHEDTAKYRPQLAHHMARTEDFLTYTFRLRDDIFWHKPTLDLTNPQYNWLVDGKTCREGHFINERCRVTAYDIVYAF